MARATLKDVAARAGVSYQTVSKVLNQQGSVTPATEARIWQAARELNYRPNVSARNLRTQSSRLIGYAWQRAADTAPRPILDQFLYHAALAFEKEGYHLLTFIVDRDEHADFTSYQELYGRNQVDGFILADTNHDDPRIEFLIEQQIPFASFGRANDDWHFCWVDVDGRYGMRTVIDHLLQRGHRRIALLTWPAGSEAGAYREAGYEEALRAAGIAVDPAWIMRGENSVQHGANGITRLLAMPAAERPTAVACVSDNIAVGAINAATAAGFQVGEDLAITGFDDAPLAQFLHPPLTSVRQPIPAVGQHVANLLLKQINEDPVAEMGILLKPELIIRASSQREYEATP